MSRTGFKKKGREIVIELVHHIRPPVRTQDRDKYKNKHPDKEKSFSYRASSSKRDHMNLLINITMYVTAHTARDILGGQF